MISKQSSFNRVVFFSFILSSSLYLLGCKGDRGDIGPMGPEGPAGPAGGSPVVDTSNTGAVRFSGQYGYVEVPSSPVYKSATFTVELWVYMDTLYSAFIPLISSAGTDDRNTADGFSVKYESGYLYLRLAESSSIGYVCATSFSPPIKQWFHVAGTFDGSTARLYVNGQQIAQLSTTKPIWYGTHGLTFGLGYHSNFGGYSSFRGMMDEIRIWNRARSASELASTMRMKLKEDQVGLVGYWDFDLVAFGYLSNDGSEYNNHGILWGDAQIVQTVPF